MSTKPSTAFGIKVYGIPITSVKAKRVIETGITSFFQLPGNITWFEEHDARIKAGYTLDEWHSTDYRDRTFEVAHYRVRNMIEMRKSESLLEAQESNMARMKRRRR